MKYNFDEFLPNAQTRLRDNYNTLEIADTILDIAARVNAIADNEDNRQLKEATLAFFNLTLNGGERTDTDAFNDKRRIIRNFFLLTHPDRASNLKTKLNLTDQEADELLGVTFAKLTEASKFTAHLFNGEDNHLNFNYVQTFDILRIAFRILKDRQEAAARGAAPAQEAAAPAQEAAAPAQEAAAPAQEAAAPAEEAAAPAQEAAAPAEEAAAPAQEAAAPAEEEEAAAGLNFSNNDRILALLQELSEALKSEDKKERKKNILFAHKETFRGLSRFYKGLPTEDKQSIDTNPQFEGLSTVINAFDKIESAKEGSTVTVDSVEQAREIAEQGGMAEVANHVSIHDQNTCHNIAKTDHNAYRSIINRHCA